VEKGKNVEPKFFESLKSFYKDYDGALDAKVTAKLLALYTHKTPAEFLPKGFAEFKDEEANLKAIEEWSKNSVITGRKALNGAYVTSDLD
ncbi:hypothetical protein SMA37_26270, partial [Escherichia coli]